MHKERKKTMEKEKREKVFVPRGASNEEPNLFISVNGVNYLLPKGKESSVPAAVAKEYRRSLAARERSDLSGRRLMSK
jgi:hypothetical protein